MPWPMHAPALRARPCAVRASRRAISLRMGDACDGTTAMLEFAAVTSTSEHTHKHCRCRTWDLERCHLRVSILVLCKFTRVWLTRMKDTRRNSLVAHE